VHVASPALDQFPAEQVVQSCALSWADASTPSSGRNAPAGQFVHDATPPVEYSPDGQTGYVESPLQYEPAGQLLQVVRVADVPPEV